MSAHPIPPSIALLGNPNCGKTALFNAITHTRQKVGNYPGVTVEKKEGRAETPSGQALRIIDLPGTYSLDAKTPDEELARDVLLGRFDAEPSPHAILAVADATNLPRSLALVLELKELGYPMVLAVNMVDLAEKRGGKIDIQSLSRELGIPVVATVAIHEQGIKEILSKIETLLEQPPVKPSSPSTSPEAIRKRFKQIDDLLTRVVKRPLKPTLWTDRIDNLVLHPFWGSLILLLVLAMVFQAIFNWAAPPMDFIRVEFDHFGHWLETLLPAGAFRSLLVDGIIAGCGSILVFLPQILLLYLFLLILEDSGYMARGAFLMDKVMGKAGLHGRAFIPLLSSFACAVPGIMATRTIEDKRDRLITILVAPLITCSARLPVYSLLIAAFIPDRVIFEVLGLSLGLRGLVMLALYLSGIGAALLLAVVFKKTVLKGPTPALLLELPTYKWPSFKNIAYGLWDRGKVFVVRAGTVIMAFSILLWFLASYPKPSPEIANLPNPPPAITTSFVGQLGKVLEPLVAPIGFNWQIAVSLIPGFAAREIMISALGTVYAVEANEQEGRAQLGTILAQQWSLATALSLLAWYVFSCQCLSTLAVTRRETNSWTWPAIMFGYMTALAYLASFITFQLALKLGWGDPMNQETLAFIVVGIAALGLLIRGFDQYLTKPLAKYLLKQGKIKWAMRFQKRAIAHAAAHSCNCGSAGSCSSAQKKFP